MGIADDSWRMIWSTRPTESFWQGNVGGKLVCLARWKAANPESVERTWLGCILHAAASVGVELALSAAGKQRG